MFPSGETALSVDMSFICKLMSESSLLTLHEKKDKAFRVQKKIFFHIEWQTYDDSILCPFIHTDSYL